MKGPQEVAVETAEQHNIQESVFWEEHISFSINCLTQKAKMIFRAWE